MESTAAADLTDDFQTALTCWYEVRFVFRTCMLDVDGGAAAGNHCCTQ